MKAVFTNRTALTDTITTFRFKPDRPLAFTAGQFITLTLTGHVEAGEPAERWFTISSSPREDEVSITTRVGTSSHTAFKRALNTLKPGAAVDISEPLGDFVLPKIVQTPLLFIAGGIGVTPFNSILSWLDDTGESRPIDMIYSVTSEDDIIFQDTFDNAKQHVTIVVQQPSAAWGGERGPLTAEMILGLYEPTDDTLIYVSGPEPFVQELTKDLRNHGVAAQSIVHDEFQGYDEI